MRSIVLTRPRSRNSAKTVYLQGKAQKDYRKLRSMLEKIGIYLVPVSEIENFCRKIGLEGPKFVTKLMFEKSLDDEGLEKLRTSIDILQTPGASFS